MLPGGEGLVDADGTRHDELIELAEVLGCAGGDEELGAGGCAHSNLFPGLAEGAVLVLVFELGELVELAAVDGSPRVVVTALVWELAWVEAPDVLDCLLSGEIPHGWR